MHFIETPIFTKLVEKILTEEEYRSLQVSLVIDPKRGALIPGCSGLRKLRWNYSKQGKRSGVRLIYYFHSLVGNVYMLYLFKKNDKVDLTKEQLKILSNYVKKGVL